MSVFKDHKISLKQVLEFIPEALLTHLSATTKVDYYSKVLHGKKMFYLLLFCIFDNEKLSQRTLEDTFNSSGFKALFGLGEKEKVRRSSISRGSPKLTLIISKKSTSRCTEGFLNFIRRPKSKSTT
ncbi:hypothetical protein LDL59_04340 [Kaistella anthropi]|nr:hypothetical protein [Kaistella anthropi]